MNRWKSLTLLVLVLLMMVMSVVPAFAASPAQKVQTNSTLRTAGVSEFARCFVQTYKLIPEAKKLSPEGYQQMERLLNTVFKGTHGLKLEPHTAALMIGAKIGKLIGYDLVWIIGVVQSCWPTLGV